MYGSEDFQEYYYYLLRAAARKLALDEINAKIRLHGGASIWAGTELGSMDEQALDFMDNRWVTPPNADWRRLWRDACRSPSRFDIAVWQTVANERVLMGAAIGSRSAGNQNLTLNWFARNPGTNYSRFGVGLSILSCFEYYGDLLEVKKLLIKNPTEPTFWEAQGYVSTRVQGSNCSYWSKEI